MRIVDAQIHLWRHSSAPSHHWRGPLPIEKALAEMRLAGVSRAVNCPPPWEADAVPYAVEAARRHPDQFATMGAFDLRPEREPNFLDEWLDQPGMTGLRFIFSTPEQIELFTSGRLDWLWEAADRLETAIALGVHPGLLAPIGLLADRFPRMRLAIDHLGVGPFSKLPEAFGHLEDLLALSRLPNVAVKATAVPSMATDPYPFESTHGYLHRIFDAFGPNRMFWGTDYTRMAPSWSECVALFTEHLPWLSGRDLELVMGDALCDWIGWS